MKLKRILIIDGQKLEKRLCLSVPVCGVAWCHGCPCEGQGKLFSILG